MRLSVYDGFYVLSLSARETEAWATRPGGVWPCSTLRGKRLRVTVDTNGICDYAINGRQPTAETIDRHELEAIVADYTAGTNAAKYWPRWEF